MKEGGNGWGTAGTSWQRQPSKLIAGDVFNHHSDAYGDFMETTWVYGKQDCRRRECDFSTPYHLFLCTCFRILFFLYRIWSKKVLTRKLGELIPIAERAIAALKAAGRDDLEEDIEDAEFLIEDYKKDSGSKGDTKWNYLEKRLDKRRLTRMRELLTAVMTQNNSENQLPEDGRTKRGIALAIEIIAIITDSQSRCIWSLQELFS